VLTRYKLDPLTDTLNQGRTKIDPLLEFREEFPILATTNYLVSNSLGPMPRTVPERLAEYAREWGEAGVRAWARDWWMRPVRAGNEIAPLIGAGDDEVTMMPNVSLAQSTVVSAMDFTGGRDTIVMTSLDFPSVRYAVEKLAERLGARVVVVRSEDGISIDDQQIMEAIDERTRLVAISHVAFKSAYIFDLKAIAERAHSMGAFLSVDAFHSVGVIPVDVVRDGVDFLSGGVLKWLCGGPGGCFLYASPRVRESLEPALTGWVGHARPFEFEESMDYAAGSYRWMSGTPGIPALYAAVEGPKIIRRAGMDRIREKSKRMTARLVELADERGYRLTAPRDPEKRGGSVTFDVPHGYEVAQYLISRNIIVDYRAGAGIRIAPHFFTSDGEIDSAIQEIDAVLKSGEWKKFGKRSSVVT
jgi:kynureninase